MNGRIKQVLVLLRGNAQAGRVVPRSGVTVWLTVLSSAAMTALAVLVMLSVSISGRAADNWGRALALSATVQVTDESAARSALEQVLRTTGGIAGFERISAEVQRDLLEPVLGDAAVQITLPALYAVRFDPGATDAARTLSLRLAAELPDAVFDDNAAWRRPLVGAARAIGHLGLIGLSAVLLALAAVVVLAVEAVISANRGNIGTLRLIGATDRFIVRAFVRQITLCAALGAIIGLVLGAGSALLILNGVDAVLPLPRLAGWMGLIALVPLVAGLAFVATRIAAFRALRRTY